MKLKIVILAVLLMLLAIALPAQTLHPDKNGTPIQGGRTFSTLTRACTADTMWTRVTVPANTYSVYLLPSAGLNVSADSTYTNPVASATLSATTPVELPVLSKPYFYVRRAAVGTAASAYLIFKRM